MREKMEEGDMVREIALDTETTGFYFDKGDRLTEIGCVELVDKELTGKSFHVYINPEREVGAGAQQVTGLTLDFLQDFPTFDQLYKEFLDFIRGDRLIIHNAPFDIGFLNHELVKAGAEPLSFDRVLDTLPLARKKFPGSPANLDALCKRFSIDSSNRNKHGALIDAELLAHVYVALTVETVQKDLFQQKVPEQAQGAWHLDLPKRPKLAVVSEAEVSRHEEFLKKVDNAVWRKYAG